LGLCVFIGGSFGCFFGVEFVGGVVYCVVLVYEVLGLIWVE